MKDLVYDQVLADGIENFEKKISDYALWILKGGIRIQKGWAIAISCPTNCSEFARVVTREAYNCGARDVTVYWEDPYINREKFSNSDEAYLTNTEPWPDLARKKYENKDMAFVVVKCGESSILSVMDADSQIKNSSWISADYTSFKRGLEIPYTITGAATREWANEIYPDMSVDDAYIKLWNNLFDIARIDGKTDPVQEWFNHCEEMQKHSDILNDYHFHHLHYTSELGTDCIFELPEKHKWIATAENTSAHDLKFSANMPTEEVFCVPNKFGVNGTIVSDKPIVAHSGLISNLKLKVKDGKVVEYSAKEGQDILDALIDSDKNGRYLGEIAIVPYDTPISQQGIVYFNILFDENSGCHTAIGNAYSKCLVGGLQMTDEELEANGLNICKFHEDFVFGTKDTKIVGTTYDGQDITIFKHGAFTI